jgi:hypothetical protein
MRAIIVLAGVFTVALLVCGLRGTTSAQGCADSCKAAYAACSKECKNTDCFTKCLNQQSSCLVRCPA